MPFVREARHRRPFDEACAVAQGRLVQQASKTGRSLALLLLHVLFLPACHCSLQFKDKATCATALSHDPCKLFFLMVFHTIPSPSRHSWSSAAGQMNEWMDESYHKTLGDNGRVWEIRAEGGGGGGGGGAVKWVSSRRTIVAYLWESRGRRGGERKAGRNREVELAGPSVPIMDINNIHTELP